MHVQNVTFSQPVAADKLIETIDRLHVDGYQSIIVSPLDTAADPPTYGVAAVRVVEE